MTEQEKRTCDDQEREKRGQRKVGTESCRKQKYLTENVNDSLEERPCLLQSS